jgi:hypothetical protein
MGQLVWIADEARDPGARAEGIRIAPSRASAVWGIVPTAEAVGALRSLAVLTVLSKYASAPTSARHMRANLKPEDLRLFPLASVGVRLHGGRKLTGNRLLARNKFRLARRSARYERRLKHRPRTGKKILE